MTLLAARPDPTDYDAPAADRAAAGAALLDHHLPGWADRVARPVQVDSVTDCPVAQVYGSWVGGALRLDHGETVGYGFLSRGFERDREALEAAWAGEITRRGGRILPSPRRGLARLLWWRRVA